MGPVLVASSRKLGFRALMATKTLNKASGQSQRSGCNMIRSAPGRRSWRDSMAARAINALKLPHHASNVRDHAALPPNAQAAKTAATPTCTSVTISMGASGGPERGAWSP